MRTIRVTILVLLVALIFPGMALAHGVQITHQEEKTIEITAAYDSGEPLSEGQVSVFAPDNRSTPWITGQCDQEGRFVFTPDSSKPGVWDVQVRKAGHGGMIYINVAEPVVADKGYTTPQIILMVASVTWGFIGTALYFRRRKS